MHQLSRRIDGIIINKYHFIIIFVTINCLFGNKIFIDAIAKVAAATKRHGKALGRLVPNVETGIEYNKLGFDFICYSGDVWILQGALTDAVGKLRDGCISKE